MANENQTGITKEGAEKLKEELNRLINIERPLVIDALASARAQGDLKENADYDAARNRQAEVEGRIKRIQDILANTKIVKENRNNDKIIGIGSKVTLLNLKTKEEEVYTVVGTVEADPIHGMISNESPLGLAISSHKVDDEVDVRSKRPYRVKIINIEKKR